MIILNAVTDLWVLLTSATRLSNKELQYMSKQQLATRLRDFTQQYSSEFLDWLAGLLEADGSAPNSTRGDRSVYISQSVTNTLLIVFIFMKLGIGKVRFQYSEGMVHWVIEDDSSLILFLSLINGRLRTQPKDAAFSLLASKLAKLYPDLGITFSGLNPAVNANWLAGFTDGDGSFFISIVKSSAMTLGFQVTLQVAWTQLHKDTLLLIRDFLSSQGITAGNVNSSVNGYQLVVKRQPSIRYSLYSLMLLYTV